MKIKLYCLGFLLFALILSGRALATDNQEPFNKNLPDTQKPAQESVDQSVGRAVSKMTDIHDIKDPVRPGLVANTKYYILGGLLLIGVIAFIIWYIKRKRNRARAIKTLIPELLPEIIALNQLDKLAAKAHIEQKIFYFRLSAIMRKYLDARYHIKSMEMTSEEFIPAINKLNIENNLQESIRKLILSTDPIKFAKIDTTKDKITADLEFVKQLVNQTTPNPQAEETHV